MSAQEALQAIYDEHGVITPALVVEAAANPDSELHSRFEWDDSEAARKFRLVQAGVIIRNVKVQVQHSETEVRSVRAFVANHELGLTPPVASADLPEEPNGTYRRVEDVIASDVLRTAWFRSLERDWKHLKARAGSSREFANMVLSDIHEVTA